MVERIARDVDPGAKVVGKISGEAFLTPPGDLSALVAEAIPAETDIVPELSTTGGTSDARFLHALCPVVEFVLTNATIHKLDEAAAVEDMHTLAAIYRGVLLLATLDSICLTPPAAGARRPPPPRRC